MRHSIFLVVLLSAASMMASANAQTPSPRERAVAIDRVPIPPADMMQVERIGPPMKAPWAIAFLPDGAMLVTEKHGGVRHIQRNGVTSAALAGGPANVFQKSDSGLLDIVLDPDFASNRFVYLAFVEGGEAANRTAIWRAKFDGTALTEGRVVFRANQDKEGTGHPGGRMLLLPDRTLLLTVGDGFTLKEKAQDPASHLGKVLRLTRDGAAAPDNPFAGRAGYAPEIWSLGHRNIQGLTRDPATGIVWSHEHGPRGGDEINVLEPGRNYGWPLATNGIDYDGTLISDRAHGPDWASPRLAWAPSIAPSGLAVYHGTRFPALNGRLLIGGLASRSVSQVRIHPKTGLLAEEARLLAGYKQRIRDVRAAPDGNIYLLTDGDDGRLLRLIPPEAVKPLPADHPLTPLAFLAGEWSGESVHTPPFRPQAPRVRQSTRTQCAFILGNAYLRCHTRFLSTDGSTWDLEHQFRRGRRDPGIQARLLEEGYAGDWVYDLKWDEARKALVAEYEAEIRGEKVVERYTMSPGPDGNSFVQTEDVRLFAPGSPWQQTRRWTWTRQR